jgi:hypothetical protein
MHAHARELADTGAGPTTRAIDSTGAVTVKQPTSRQNRQRYSRPAAVGCEGLKWTLATRSGSRSRSLAAARADAGRLERPPTTRTTHDNAAQKVS